MNAGLTAVYRQRIAKEEKRIGEPLSTAYEMLDASVGLFTKYAMAAPFHSDGSAAPKAALQVARIAALRAEDCGPCVRIGAAYARLGDLPEGQVRAAMTGRYGDLPEELALAAEFADAVGRSLLEAVDLGDAIERRWGRPVRVELAVAVATARFHPAFKRGLGLAESCSIIDDAA